MELPEYKKMALDRLNVLKTVASEYCGAQSPLPAEKARELGARIAKAESVCGERLQKFRPRVMLYGVYNSGKSTLLNALLGENRAEVDDIPKTCKVTAYDWHGHEIIDTPGIDAPIEHTEISQEALRSSQIILFVVSSRGSFESGKIYQAMRDVVDQRKRLLIILNNKDDEYAEEELAGIKDRIQKILESQGFSREKAASFRLTPVNAQYGLEARLEGDEELENYSGIKNVEQLIYEEVGKADGYAVIKDVLAYLAEDGRHLLKLLSEALAKGDKTQNEAFLNIREQYHDFRERMDNYVTQECGQLAGEIYHCFPAPGGDFPADQIKNCIEAVLDSCLREISGKADAEMARFQDTLLRQGARILQSGETRIEVDRELSQYEDLLATLAKMSQVRQEASSSFSRGDESDWLDTVGNTAMALNAIPILKLPLPFPIPPALIPIILTGIKIIASLFGKSDAEKENARMEAQIRAEREMLEKQARAQERQRAEIREYSEEIKNKFVRELKASLRENIGKRFQPVLDALQAQCDMNKEMDVKLRGDIAKLGEIISDLQNRMAELA